MAKTKSPNTCKGRPAQDCRSNQNCVYTAANVCRKAHNRARCKNGTRRNKAGNCVSIHKSRSRSRSRSKSSSRSHHSTPPKTRKFQKIRIPRASPKTYRKLSKTKKMAYLRAMMSDKLKPIHYKKLEDMDWKKLSSAKARDRRRALSRELSAKLKHRKSKSKSKLN